MYPCFIADIKYRYEFGSLWIWSWVRYSGGKNTNHILLLNKTRFVSFFVYKRKERDRFWIAFIIRLNVLIAWHLHLSYSIFSHGFENVDRQQSRKHQFSVEEGAWLCHSRVYILLVPPNTSARHLISKIHLVCYRRGEKQTWCQKWTKLPG